jgi:hypothetical protein
VEDQLEIFSNIDVDSKLNTFAKCYKECNLQKYLDFNLPKPLVKSLTKLRISAHTLVIEKSINENHDLWPSWKRPQSTSKTSCKSPISHLDAKFEAFLCTPSKYLQNLLWIFSKGRLSLFKSFCEKSLIQICLVKARENCLNLILLLITNILKL